MNTPIVATRTLGLYARPTLRSITVAALVANALLFGFDTISSGPDDINLTHVIISLVVASIMALRLRWTRALGAPRAAGEAFTPAERRLLEDIALQAGVAAHAMRLTTDLQRSRERLVTAREEERSACAATCTTGWDRSWPA